MKVSFRNFKQKIIKFFSDAMNFIYIIQGNGAFQAPPSLMEAWDESYNRGRMLGVELGEESPSSQGPYSSFHVLPDGWPRAPYSLEVMWIISSTTLQL